MTKPSLFRESSFLRFALVGVLNTAFGYCLFALLNLMGLTPHAALAIAFSGGVMWNFMTHARLVFGTKGFGRLPFYILSYLVIYGINALSLEAFLSMGLSPMVAQGIIVLPVAVLSYAVISRVLTGRFPWSPKQQEG